MRLPPGQLFALVLVKPLLSGAVAGDLGRTDIANGKVQEVEPT